MFSRELRPIELANLSRYRTELYGGFAIWILAFHLQEWGIFTLLKGSTFPGKLFSHFLTLGSMGVDAFLVLSGMSLYFSMKKNKNIYEFAARRISRLLPSVALLFGGLWISSFILEENLPQLIVRFAGLSLWFEVNKTGTWYVSAILVCYFLYPYIYAWLFSNGLRTWRLFERWSLLLLLSLVSFWAMHKLNPDYFKLTEIALGRIPGFLFGCLMGKGVYEKKTIDGRWMLPIILGAALFYIVVQPEYSWHWWTRCLYPIGGTLALFVFVSILAELDTHNMRTMDGEKRPLWALLRISGTLSLELYLGSVALVSLIKIVQTSFGFSVQIVGPWMQIILSIMFSMACYAIALASHRCTSVFSQIRDKCMKYKCQ